MEISFSLQVWPWFFSYATAHEKVMQTPAPGLAGIVQAMNETESIQDMAIGLRLAYSAFFVLLRLLSRHQGPEELHACAFAIL